MTKTLEEKIEGRIKQAQERNIIEKAKVVAESLGTPVKYENDDVREEGYCYEGKRLKVTKKTIDAFPTHGFAGRNLVFTTVKYEGETRFESEDSDIKSYIPGFWEKMLDRLYDKVRPPTEPKSEEQQRIYENQLREKAAKFGFKILI